MPDPTVVRAAADALGRHPDPADVRRCWRRSSSAHGAGDPFLVHTVRIALRDHLAQTNPEKAIPLAGWNEQETAALADVAVGVPTPGAASFLLDRLKIFQRHQSRVDHPLASPHRPISSGRAIR